METFNNHLCYVILFENHQHGGTHGMTNRLRGYTRQKRLGNTVLHIRILSCLVISQLVLKLFLFFSFRYSSVIVPSFLRIRIENKNKVLEDLICIT